MNPRLRQWIGLLLVVLAAFTIAGSVFACCEDDDCADHNQCASCSQCICCAAALAPASDIQLLSAPVIIAGLPADETQPLPSFAAAIFIPPRA